MRRTFILAALVISAGTLSVVLAQEKSDPIVSRASAELPGQLEPLLAEVLNSNPDILLAESGVRQAQAVLNQTRLDVAQRAAGLFHERLKLQSVKSGLGKSIAEEKHRYGNEGGTQTRVRELGFALAETDAKLAQAEAELRYMLGIGGTARAARLGSFLEPGGGEKRSEAKKILPRTILEEAPGYRAMLRTMTVSWDAAPIGAVLADLQKATDDELAFVRHTTIDSDDYLITLHLPGEVPVKTVLVALADYFEGYVCFVCREYGVLVTDNHTARRLEGAVIPSGTIYRPERER